MLIAVALCSTAACDLDSSDLDLEVWEDPDRPNALWVAWSTAEPSQGEVVVDGEHGERIALSSDGELTDHLFPILGLPAETGVEIRATSQTADGPLEQVVTSSTGSISRTLPRMNSRTWNRDLASPEAYLLLGLGSDRWSGLLVVNRHGRLVWWHELEPGTDFVETGMSPELPGALSLVWTSEDEAIHQVPFDSRDPVVVTELPDAHHAYAPLPDGRLVYCYEDCRSWEHDSLGQEVYACGDGLGILEADGSISTLFTTWDWGMPEERDLRNSTARRPEDWTHANAVAYHPERDTLLLSLRDELTVLEVDLQTGQVVDEHGLSDGAAGFADGTEAFNYQHDPNWTGDDTMLMVSTDWHDEDSLGRETCAVEYSLDPDDGRLEELWSYEPGPDIYSWSGGGARRLANGNTLVHWRHPKARVREVSPEGEVVWELLAKDGDFRIGTVQLFESFYQVEADD